MSQIGDVPAPNPATASVTTAPREKGQAMSTESASSSGMTSGLHGENIPHPQRSEDIKARFGTYSTEKAPWYRQANKSETFHDLVHDSYRNHSYQYWFVATTANGILWSQIAIAATLTALAAIRTPEANTGVIVLGAINAVLAGLSTYFKSRNQPARSRKLRTDLARVRDAVHALYGDLADPNFVISQTEYEKRINDVRTMYDNAREDAEGNYPENWISVKDLLTPELMAMSAAIIGDKSNDPATVSRMVNMLLSGSGGRPSRQAPLRAGVGSGGQLLRQDGNVMEGFLPQLDGQPGNIRAANAAGGSGNANPASARGL